MSAPFKAGLDFDSRLAYQEFTRAYLRGEQPKAIFAEQFDSLEMTELDDNADASDEVAADLTQSSHPYLRRMSLMLAMALQRDARYAHVNRRYLFALGESSKLREDFEAFATVAKNIGGVP